MATGPAHYTMAEDLIGGIEEDGGYFTPEGRTQVIALAQVHATLSLAAATALGREGAGRMMPGRERQAWFDVAAEAPKQVAS